MKRATSEKDAELELRWRFQRGVPGMSGEGSSGAKTAACTAGLTDEQIADEGRERVIDVALAPLTGDEARVLRDCYVPRNDVDMELRLGWAETANAIHMGARRIGRPLKPAECKEVDEQRHKALVKFRNNWDAVRKVLAEAARVRKDAKRRNRESMLAKARERLVRPGRLALACRALFEAVGLWPQQEGCRDDVDDV